ncbi:MAG: radical SAM protein [Elusimicrobiota bacterium]|jgi:anaerobic magnesium-protoporphyrin IX monomethyl ester cyclase
MKVALINANILDINNVFPPMGILHIGAVLEKAGHQVRLYDFDPNVDQLASKYLAEIRQFQPDLVGIGFLTVAHPRASSLVKMLRREVPRAKICCGGIHTTVEPVNVLNEFGVDFCVVGEGEATMAEACERLASGRGLDRVQGLVFRDANRAVVDNGRRDLIPDLDSLPLPARHLIDFETLYVTFPGVIRGKAIRSTSIITSRGCPYRCIFCGTHNISHWTVRRRSVESVLAEISELVRTYKIEGVFFSDDTFTLNHEWVLRLCRGMLERNIRLTWASSARVDTITEELVLAMKEAGCMQLDFGIESGSEKILKVLRKSFTPDKIRNAVRIAKKFGIRVSASFMIGNPEETDDDIEQTRSMAKELAIDYATFFYTTPFPGTELYTMAKENGWIPPGLTYSDMWTFRQSKYPIMTAKLTKEALSAWHGRLQNDFFMSNYFHLRNVQVILALLGMAVKRPSMALGAAKRVLQTRRLDSLAEELFKGYRLERILGKKTA